MNKERRHEIANALDAFFDSPAKWGKGVNSNEATWCRSCFCLATAGNELGFDHNKVAEVLGFNHQVALYEWNDAPERTFEDIKQRIWMALADEYEPLMTEDLLAKDWELVP